MSQAGDQIVFERQSFEAALSAEILRMGAAAEGELEAMGQRIADRAIRIEGIPGPIRDSIGVGKEDGHLVVGVLPSSPIKVTTGGDEKPSRAATAEEYGHHDGSTYVPPHPFMRPAIAAEISASGGAVGGSE